MTKPGPSTTLIACSSFCADLQEIADADPNFPPRHYLDARLPMDQVQLRAEGGFFAFPEWARRWREFFQHDLGLNPESAKSLLRDLHSFQIFINTGLRPVPQKSMIELAKLTGFPWAIQAADTGHLARAIREILIRLEQI